MQKGYEMFTENGDWAVHVLVIRAQTFRWGWKRVLKELKILAREPEFAEATDTAVREAVYERLGFKEPFYV